MTIISWLPTKTRISIFVILEISGMIVKDFRAPCLGFG